MKMLKEPTLISWKTEKKCLISDYGTGCGALLEIETEDIYLTNVTKYYRSDEGNVSYFDSAFAFKCPNCGKENIINDKDIPLEVRNSIKSVEQNRRAKRAYMKNKK